MHRFRANAVSNIATKLWSLVSIYIFIPLYIKILGETSYGLVAFFATLQTTLNLLGLGLSNTLKREFAVGENSEENSSRKYKLMRSIEIIYFGIGIIIICICIFGSGFIAEQWLNIEELNSEVVATVVSLMGFSIALQLIANLYAGCLFGLNSQVLANTLCVLWSVAKSVGSLAIIALVSPNLVYFYSWHILTDLVYLILLRVYSIKKLNLPQKIGWRWSDIKNIKSIWKYTCGILFISFIALINKQLDKVIISKYLTLSELGAYNVSTTLGSLTTIFPAAIYITVFPRFTNYATTNNKDLLKKEFTLVNKIVNLVVASTTSYIAIYALPLIKIWTGSDSYVEILGIVGCLVVLAVGMIEFQEIPYALALAHGNTKYNVLVGLLFIPIVTASTLVGIKNWGLFGAGAVYLIMMLGQTLVYEYLVYRKYIGHPIKWIIRATVLPLTISILMAYLSKVFINNFFLGDAFQTLYAVLCGAITLCILIFAFTRDDFKIIIKMLKKGEIKNDTFSQN